MYIQSVLVANQIYIILNSLHSLRFHKGHLHLSTVFPMGFPQAIWAKLNPALATKLVSKYACGLRCDLKRWCVRCRELHLWRQKNVGKVWEIWDMLMYIHVLYLFEKTPEYFLRSGYRKIYTIWIVHNSTWRRLELFCRRVAPRSTITLLWRLILPLCDPAAQRTSFAFQFVAPRFVWVGSRAKVSTFSDFQKAAVGEICGSWAYMQILNKILPNIPKRQGPGNCLRCTKCFTALTLTCEAR